MKINKEEIKDFLVGKGKYDDYEIKNFLENFPDEVNDSLEPVLTSYLNNGNFTDITIDGVSFSEAMENSQSDFFAVLKEFNVFLETDEESEEREIMRNYLKRPKYIE